MLNFIFMVAMSRWGMGEGDWGMIEQDYFKLFTIQTILSAAESGRIWKMIWANVLVIECILSFQSPSSQIPNFLKHFLPCNSPLLLLYSPKENIKHGKPLKRWKVSDFVLLGGWEVVNQKAKFWVNILILENTCLFVRDQKTPVKTLSIG